ncbi:MAG: GGDEF domain-containing protein, partial [Spirochaetales bacterium]|nr:GGDEF domain-containing protein [Spirochaetales bacterium]
RELFGEVRKDPLTGVFNRRVLDLLSPRDYELVALIDLDNFKRYNDNRGHQAGDELLKSFAELIKRNLRSEDLVVRYGGDEFLIFLKSRGKAGGVNVFKRIHEEFLSMGWDDYLGFSYGVETLQGDRENLDNCLVRADLAMYRMKARRKAGDGAGNVS